MKKLSGTVLLIGGLVASLVFGLEAYQNTESIKLFGNKFTLSQANWTPLIISLVITLLGVILIASSKSKSRSGRRK